MVASELRLWVWECVWVGGGGGADCPIQVRRGMVASRWGSSMVARCCSMVANG